MTAAEVLDFVERHGVVLMSARGPVPSLAEAIAGGPIRGSWWSHPKSHEIFRLLGVACDSPDVLVCRLVNGKVTLVHRRLWPALVRLSRRLPKGGLAAVREEHTTSGRHRTVETPYPRWVPRAVKDEAKRLGEAEAAAALGEWLAPRRTVRPRPGPAAARLLALAVALLGLVAAARPPGQEAPAPPPAPPAIVPAEGGQPGADDASKLHDPRELFDLMEKSSIVYELDLDEGLPAPARGPGRVLSDDLVLKKEAGGTSLATYEPPAEAAGILEAAGKALDKQDYDQALALYERLRTIAPDYHRALTLIGEVQHARGDHEKAIASFERAIEANFADYAARWRMADSEWKLGRKSEAMRSITAAHLLNVNHEPLRKALLEYRSRIGRPWKDWEYAPRYRLSRDGKKVKVKFAEDWMGYAIAKAIWKYEPGYAESMEGPDYKDRAISMLEEKEALLGALATNKKLANVSLIIEDGYVDEFIVYEVLARKVPGALVLLPPEYFDRLVRYVDTYH